MKLVSSFLNLLHIDCYTLYKLCCKKKYMETNNEKLYKRYQKNKPNILSLNKAIGKIRVQSFHGHSDICL